MQPIIEATYEQIDATSDEIRCIVKFIDGTSVTYTNEEDLKEVQQILYQQMIATQGE